MDALEPCKTGLKIAVCLPVACNQHGVRAVNENQHNTNAAIMRVVEVIIDVRKEVRGKISMLTSLRASSRMQCEQLFQDGKQAQINATMPQILT
jgi:hypothetical protein